MPLTPLPHGITFTEVGYTAPGGGVDPQPIVLGPLTLSAATAPADAEAGTVIGLIQGKTAGSSLSITPNDGRVALAGDDVGGWNLVVGLTAISEGELLVTIRETHPDAEGPSDNLVAITITPAMDDGVPPDPPSGFAYVVNDEGSYFVDGNGAYYIMEIE
ncbi:hypothetical protein GCM10017620_25910 [Brevundimonas intermedia]|uniref:RapA2 cadherin-like domain-containing protein n=1 Tax=Brevundimonas intermedia TaxID=74315 RepID=A0ABQ5TEI2_9CAUL|nr:hypothetical protein [Brevundimonas intermedia]GLK49618.1 hypothetical protein GCM10017620_25910 [Brevundimonas intermedia]